MIWVVVTDTNNCRIYQYQKHPAQIQLIKDLNEPQNKLKKSEFLTTDRPGHYHSSSTIRGAYSPHSDEKEVLYEDFARDIAKELNNGRNAHSYEQLIIIAPPHMYGLLRKHMDKNVQELITDDLQKDIMHLNEKELLDYITANIY